MSNRIPQAQVATPVPVPPASMLNAKSLLNQMAYEILIASKNAAQYKKMLEHMLMCPTFIFGKDISIAAANEGRNEFIRALINGAHLFMTTKPQDDKPKKIKRSRKEVIHE